MVDARVISGEPISAVGQELRDTDDAGVVISTLYGERSAWLKMGLPQKIAVTFGGRCGTSRPRPEWAGP